MKSVNKEGVHMLDIRFIREDNCENGARDYRSLLIEIELQKKAIHNQVKYGILDLVEATHELKMVRKREYKLKEALVKEYHVQKDGTPRKITYKEERGLFTTFMPDRTRISSKSKEELIDKLMAYYSLTIADTSFKSIFELALKEKAITENPDEKTIEHYRNDYKRFISDELGSSDIRKLSRVDLQKYTQELVNSNDISYKAFLKYKSVLNITFKYALLNDIITTNPVIHINNNVYKKSCVVTSASSEDKIFSESEIELIKTTIRKKMNYKNYEGYFINGYAMLFAIQTGVRCAELCSLKWTDIKESYIHIHSQQLKKKGEHQSIYYYAPYTKNEKGISKNGRQFPLTNAIKDLLQELKNLQEQLNIESEYIFCNRDGEWIKTDAYETCLRRLCQSLNFKVTNNHAFRMSLNSNVLIPAGLPVTERARILGHSVETNLKYYSFAGKDSLADICELLNKLA